MTAIVNTSGTVEERFVNDAYGGRIVVAANWTTTTETKAWSQGHQGGFYDPVLTEKMLFRWRVYDVETMRWMQNDPAGYVDGVILCQYLGSNPNNSLDPFGLYEWEFEGSWTQPEKDKIKQSINRILPRLDTLLKEIDNLKAGMSKCVQKEMGQELDELRSRLNDVRTGMMGGKNIELRQQSLGRGTQARTYQSGGRIKATSTTEGTYQGPGFNDGETFLNDFGKDDWRKRTDSDLDALLLHEMAHQHEPNGDMDGTGKLYDPHVLDNLLTSDVKNLADFKNLLDAAQKKCGECPPTSQSTTQPSK